MLSGPKGGGAALVDKRMHTYLTTAEVADILHVSPKTVTRWAREGKLPHSRTLGGHRRYPGGAIPELATAVARSNKTAPPPGPPPSPPHPTPHTTHSSCGLMSTVP